MGLAAPRQWSFIGCFGTEERSLSAYFSLAQSGVLANSHLLKIVEPQSPHLILADARYASRSAACAAKHLSPSITTFDLMDPLILLEPIADQICANQSVVLDITALPKRFFFFLLKRLFRSQTVRDLVVIYTNPASYAPGPLSEDNEPWGALPTFRLADPDEERIAHRRIIVNVGFMPEGFIAHFESPLEKQIDLIVPFPSSVSSVKRAWNSVWALNATTAQTREHRVGANDMSEAFDRIISLLPDNSNLVSFAPFGPKPISAAMCLAAALTDSPVYYSQPKIYNPDYSIGVSRRRGRDEANAYWVKIDGRSLYELPAERVGLR